MLKRKVKSPVNELNKIILRELIGINGMKIKKGYLIFNNNKFDFERVRVKLIESSQNRVESLSFVKGEQVVVKLSKVLQNQNCVVLDIDDDLIDDELHIKNIKFEGIEISLVYSF